MQTDNRMFLAPRPVVMTQCTKQCVDKKSRKGMRKPALSINAQISIGAIAQPISTYLHEHCIREVFLNTKCLTPYQPVTMQLLVSVSLIDVWKIGTLF